MVCLAERRAPALRGRGKPCPVETARLGMPGAGGGDGWLGAGYGRHADSLAARGATAPPQTSGGDSHPRRRQVAAYRLLLAGGRVLPRIPTAGRGSRDRETRGPRVEAGTVGPRAWSLCCGRRTSGSLQRRLAGAQAAGSSGRGRRACGRCGWAEVPRAEWAERPKAPAAPRGRRAGGGRRSGFRGDPAPPPAAEAEARDGRRAGAPGELLVPE